jgi:hypothetical protein
MKRLLLHLALIGLIVAIGAASAADSPSKAALKELNDFIGSWKGSGVPARSKAVTDVWSETLHWSWGFKGDDAWLTLKIDEGKHYKGGELRWLPATKRYQLTLTDKSDKKQVFEGKLADERLQLERVDPETKETQKLTFNTAAEGIRLVMVFERKPEGRTLFTREYQVGATKEGESLGTAKKKVECVVSGGLGTIAVAFKGETFYVCCTGCRDAFNENPEKYVKEFKARKK